MQGAIFNGIYALNAPDPVTCTTANCHWDKFATLAVCSSCKDVTVTTKKTCATLNLFPECNYTTPNGHNLSSSATVDGHSGNIRTTINSTAANPSPSFEWFGSMLNDTLLMTLGAIIISPIPPYASEPPSIPEGVIVDCELRWCAALYDNITVTNNVFAARRREFPLYPTGGHDNYSIGFAPAEEDRAQFPGNSTFSVYAFDTLNTGVYLTDLFTLSGSTTGTLQTLGSSNNIAEALIHTGNISKTLDNVAASMSVRVRTANASSSTANGQSFRDEVFIQVQWLWLILPAATVLCGVLFLGLTIFRSLTSKAPDWKSSTLAMLLHHVSGLDNDDGKFGSVEQMEREVKEVRVRLVRGEGGVWTFERL
jgi:hypothetical protein